MYSRSVSLFEKGNEYERTFQKSDRQRSYSADCCGGKKYVDDNHKIKYTDDNRETSIGERHKVKLPRYQKDVKVDYNSNINANITGKVSERPCSSSRKTNSNGNSNNHRTTWKEDPIDSKIGKGLDSASTKPLQRRSNKKHSTEPRQKRSHSSSSSSTHQNPEFSVVNENEVFQSGGVQSNSHTYDKTRHNSNNNIQNQPPGTNGKPKSRDTRIPSSSTNNSSKKSRRSSSKSNASNNSRDSKVTKSLGQETRVSTGRSKTKRYGTKSENQRCRLSYVCVGVTVTALVIAASVVAVVFLYGNKNDVLSDRNNGTVRIHVLLRIINFSHQPDFDNTTSRGFQNMSDSICREVYGVYQQSKLKTFYKDCHVIMMRPGSLRLYYLTTFVERPLTNNTDRHREVLTSTPAYVDRNAVWIGKYLVDINSIEISLHPFSTDWNQLHPHNGLIPDSKKLPSGQLKNISKQGGPGNTLVKDETDTGMMGNKDVRNAFSVNDEAIGSISGPNSITSLEDGEDSISGHVSRISQHVDTPRGTSNSLQPSNQYGHHDDVESPVVLTVVQRGEILLKDSATIECQVKNNFSLTTIHLNVLDTWGKTSMIKEASLPTVRSSSEFLSDHVRLYVVATATVTTIGLEFKFIDCSDVGLYVCVAMTSSKMYWKSSGQLYGKEPPDVPDLKIPITLVENRELTQPILCTGNVGFPPGQLQWEIKPADSEQFVPFDSDYESKSGPCKSFVTSSLIYTPTSDGHGSLLKCSVLNSAVPPTKDLSSVSELQILSENLCSGKRAGATIRHPYSCHKYIVCRDTSFDVKECDDEMCFDETTGRCGEIALRMSKVVAFLNEGVTSLKCTLIHVGRWTTITISKLTQEGNKSKLLAATFGEESVIFFNSSMKARLYSPSVIIKRYEAEVNVWVYDLTCVDEGKYICEVDAPFHLPDAVGEIQIAVKPEAPKMTIPNAIVERKPLRQNITCEANVGYPYGDLILMQRFQNETKFQPMKYEVATIVKTKNCSKTIKKSFSFIPSLDHNGMLITCAVENNAIIPHSHLLISMATIYVIPGNFCSKPDLAAQVHPYDCHQYIQCAEGYMHVQKCAGDQCFNPNSQRCDATGETDAVFDPKHPCKPNKNGVFFHHPILCNKYIWCVMGQEVVQHCPLGTLYIDDGQCTFEPKKSRCYRH